MVRTIYIKIENVSILLCNSRYFLIYSFILSLSAGAIIFLASIAGTYIVSGIQKVSPQNMLGRVMAIFATINNCALPIGVWLYGIIYEKFDKQLFGVLIITAVFIIFGSIKGKKIYWILQQEYN